MKLLYGVVQGPMARRLMKEKTVSKSHATVPLRPLKSLFVYLPRIPKSGSTLLLSLLYRLGERLGYLVTRNMDGVYSPPVPTYAFGLENWVIDWLIGT